MSCDTFEVDRSVILEKVVFEDGCSIGPIKAFVVEKLPLRVDLILGLDAILTHGLSIQPSSTNSVNVQIGENREKCVNMSNADGSDCNRASCSSVVTKSHEFKVQEDDFEVHYNDGQWTVTWKWKDGPPPVNNRRCNYKVSVEDKEAFDCEIQEWINEGILIPWEPTRDGEINNVLPLMSVRQEKGEAIKIRPVLDFRYLNDFILSLPGSATPLCQNRLREWKDGVRDVLSWI